MGNNAGAVPRDQRAVKGVEESVLEQKVLGDDRNERRALVEDQKGGGESGEWAIDEDENGELGKIGEGKHEAHHADRQTGSRQELREQGLPEGLVGQEVDDALSRVLEQKALVKSDTRLGTKHRP